MSGKTITGFVAWNGDLSERVYGTFDDYGDASSFIERSPYLWQQGYRVHEVLDPMEHEHVE